MTSTIAREGAMSKPEDDATLPRSMRHKRILDVAANNPDASMADLAAEVPSATPDLVERVLEQYGDPADDDAMPSTDESPMSTGTDEPSRADLTEKQLETLRAIAAHPDAPQRELAEVLDVTAATVSNRVSDIPGFDWSDRAAFVDGMFDTDDTLEESDAPADTDQSTESTAGDRPTTTEETPEMTPEQQTAMDDLSERVETIERQVAELADERTEPALLSDPDLAHKVIHACMESDAITEDEELRILKALVE